MSVFYLDFRYRRKLLENFVQLILYMNLQWKSQKKPGGGWRSGQQPQASVQKKNTNSDSLHLFHSPFYLFLILNFHGIPESQQQDLNLLQTFFQPQNRPCQAGHKCCSTYQFAAAVIFWFGDFITSHTSLQLFFFWICIYIIQLNH